MIDLHTHSIFSDGELVPAEHVRRVEVLGYRAIAITDHADSSNLDFIVPRILQAAADLNRYCATRLLAGVELTHVPPELFGKLVAKARQLGAQVVVGHGETVAEPVKQGTNRAALLAGVDLLAHPGFLSEDDARLAAEKGIFLELSGRKGHSLTNGYVARMAEKTGALLAVCADAHGPGDFLTVQSAQTVAMGAGLSLQRYEQVRVDMRRFVDSLPGK